MKSVRYFTDEDAEGTSIRQVHKKQTNLPTKILSVSIEPWKTIWAICKTDSQNVAHLDFKKKYIIIIFQFLCFIAVLV